jgi:hypothetical protein
LLTSRLCYFALVVINEHVGGKLERRKKRKYRGFPIRFLQVGQFDPSLDNLFHTAAFKVTFAGLISDLTNYKLYFAWLISELTNYKLQIAWLISELTNYKLYFAWLISELANYNLHFTWLISDLPHCK